MDAARLMVVLLVALAGGCDRADVPLPAPPPSPGERGGAYPNLPRQDCTSAVRTALDRSDWSALVAIVKGGGTIVRSSDYGESPLDLAVLRDDLDGVKALLDAGADPNMRWKDYGDRFPLQGAISAEMYSNPKTNRSAIVRLLLRYGGDPNARWCPFETRGTPGCWSAAGVTPLIMAAMLDQADVTYLLLDAGADLSLRDWTGFTALDHAKGTAVRELLLATIRQSTRSPTEPP